MKIGILGSGVVGQRLGGKLVRRGHEVCMGSRTSASEAGGSWVQQAGEGASNGTFGEAAAFGELLVLATRGDVALEVLAACSPSELEGKVLIDITNPLDFSRGFPPALFVNGHDSLGERIQKGFPMLRVVKTLHTTSSAVMIEPNLVPGEHELFLCGDDEIAKKTVETLLREDLGWHGILDLGGIEACRATEALLPLWTRLWRKLGTDNFNFKIVRGE